MNDLRRLQGRIAELERELAQARSSASAPQAQLAAAQNDLQRECAKNQELARQYVWKCSVSRGLTKNLVICNSNLNRLLQ